MTKVRTIAIAILAVIGVGVLMAAQPTNKRWEFKVAPLVNPQAPEQQKALNDMGADGWQMVTWSDGVAFMTRETR